MIVEFDKKRHLQVLDVGFIELFRMDGLDVYRDVHVGEYLVMLTQFGSDCVSMWAGYPLLSIAFTEIKNLVIQDAEEDIRGYTYEVWHIVDDSVDGNIEDLVYHPYPPTEYPDPDALSSDSHVTILLATFVPIRDKSLPLYNVECNKWSDMLAWIGAMLPVIDMASYELKTSTL